MSERTTPPPCAACQGRGGVDRPSCEGHGPELEWDCAACQGTGDEAEIETLDDLAAAMALDVRRW